MKTVIEKQKEIKIKKLLNKPFLDNLLEIAKIYGLKRDYPELINFVVNLHNIHGIYDVDDYSDENS